MNKTIGFVMVGTNDLEKSSKFYDSILVHLGMKRVTITERYIGYSHSNEDDGVKFYITKPHNKENASAGNGTMVALAAETKEAVDKFHKTALENGAVDEGTPGIRSDGNYSGYVRDHDGNKITARCVLS
jgi:predicted lactoylglutathione lyase